MKLSKVLKHGRGGIDVWRGSVERAWIADDIPSSLGMLV